jgi:hypothetical protein
MSFSDDEAVYFVSQWEYTTGDAYPLDTVNIEWSVTTRTAPRSSF